MSQAEAGNVVKGMCNDIITASKDECERIVSQGAKDFELEKSQLVNKGKDKIRKNYASMAKKVEVQLAIRKSMAINNSRLQKIQARNNVISKISEEVRASITNVTKQEAQYKELIVKLMVQGLLMLLEEDVVVKCRQVDVAMVNSVKEKAATMYSQIIKDKSGAVRKVRLTVDSENLPPAPSPAGGPSCIGGVVLACQGGAIKVDNTIDSRLQLVLEQDKPAIRGLLFPGAR